MIEVQQQLTHYTKHTATLLFASVRDELAAAAQDRRRRQAAAAGGGGR
jgi:hypothetical protein